MDSRQKDQIEKAVIILDKSAINQIIGEDVHLLFLFKKIERIVAALYILTSFLSDIEPLRWELRRLGMAFIRQSLSFRKSAFTNEWVRDMVNLVARLISLLDLAYIADLISAANFSLLKQELGKLIELVEGRGSFVPSASSSLFDKAFFDPSVLKDPDGPKKSESQPNIVHYAKGGKMGNLRKRKDGISVSSKGHFSRLVALRDGRKAMILDILKEKGACMITDISSVIHDCSVKTLQRLLNKLVQENFLEKRGEKRWRRYGLRELPEKA